MERWRSIREFPTHEVSDLGRVRKVVASKQKKAGGLLAIHVDRYRSVHLWARGKTHTRQVSRLMLEAFVGPAPSPRHQAAHNDGKPMRDVLRNVRWATPLENSADRVTHGTLRYGVSHPRTKITAATVRKVRELREQGNNYSQITAATGVSCGHASLIVHRKIWASVE